MIGMDREWIEFKPGKFICFDESHPPNENGFGAWYHLKYGVKYGYPFCCVLMFCLDSLIVKLGLAYRPSGTLRGFIDRWEERPDKTFVPCGVFHKSDNLNEPQISACVYGPLKPFWKIR